MHRTSDARVRFDSHTHFDLNCMTSGDHPLLEPVCLLHPVGHSYYHTLREKLLWNQTL